MLPQNTNLTYIHYEKNIEFHGKLRAKNCSKVIVGYKYNTVHSWPITVNVCDLQWIKMIISLLLCNSTTKYCIFKVTLCLVAIETIHYCDSHVYYCKLVTVYCFKFTAVTFFFFFTVFLLQSNPYFSVDALQICRAHTYIQRETIYLPLILIITENVRLFNLFVNTDWCLEQLLTLLNKNIITWDCRYTIVLLCPLKYKLQSCSLFGGWHYPLLTASWKQYPDQEVLFLSLIGEEFDILGGKLKDKAFWCNCATKRLCEWIDLWKMLCNWSVNP